MKHSKQKQFFVHLNKVYFYLPKQFKDKIPKSKFYRYIQDKRQEIGSDNASIKNIPETQIKAFFEEFFTFVYVNIVGFYFDLENVLKIQKDLENDFKRLCDEK